MVQQATSLLLRGAHTRALKILREAMVRYPDDPAVLTRYGDACYRSGDITPARDAYRQALALDENLFQAWYGKGMADYSFGSYGAAIECFGRALALNPGDADVRFHFGNALFRMGDVDGAIEQFRRASKSKEWRDRALRRMAIIIPGSPASGNREIRAARTRWAALEQKSQSPRVTRTNRHRARASSKKLRIGYVSSFFTDRNWMKPVWGVINHHDRSRFEIHLFADCGDSNAFVGYLANPSDVIHPLANLSNDAAARRISAARVDVLIDLNGYSAADRLGLYIRKPAPVLAAWFNMYATSGIRAFDYIIGDDVVIGPEEERFYVERVLRVSGSYLAFSVSYPVPAVVAPPSLSNGFVTFGCLAPQYKITPQVVSAWADILRAVPSARLLLKNTCLGDASNEASVRARFAQHGIAPERLSLESPAEHFHFLEAYNRIDIALDTFPYNGGTTTAEALWQGVPVLTFNGDRWVARISRSILVAAGFQGWVEPSREGYIRRAVELALSPETPRQLNMLRKDMRARLAASRACDVQTLCRELEEHYRAIVGEDRPAVGAGPSL
jgi:protein O-GlcNAc transferase